MPGEKNGANRECGECDWFKKITFYPNGQPVTGSDEGVAYGKCQNPAEGDYVDSDYDACDLFDDSGDIL